METMDCFQRIMWNLLTLKGKSEKEVIHLYSNQKMIIYNSIAFINALSAEEEEEEEEEEKNSFTR